MSTRQASESEIWRLGLSTDVTIGATLVASLWKPMGERGTLSPPIDCQRTAAVPHGFIGIVWQQYADRSPTGRVLTRAAAYPYLLDGEALKRMEAGKAVSLQLHGLLLGILTAYNEAPRYVSVATKDQFAEVIHDLATALKAPSAEVLCLDGAAYMREHHGLPASRVALRSPTMFLPQSAMTRSDLIMVDWSFLCEGAPEERTHILEEIATEYPKLDLALIDSDAAETIVLAEVLALTLLTRSSERDLVVSRDAITYVHGAAVSGRIAYLLSTATPDLSLVCRA